jgi:uncharacterized membrane protein YgdD (TMEM256/DUF423 family)
MPCLALPPQKSPSPLPVLESFIFAPLSRALTAMTDPSRMWLLIGAVLGGSAVACGAFGAHGLKSHFAKQGLEASVVEQRLANWETAARYQMYHALALIAVGLVARGSSARAIGLAGGSFTLGTLIFSGCLYAMVLTGHRWLGAVVPIGGVLLILGWVFLAVAAAGRVQ